MLSFEPDSPWNVGDIVLFRDDACGPDPIGRKVVTQVEHSHDGMESQYTLVDA